MKTVFLTSKPVVNWHFCTDCKSFAIFISLVYVEDVEKKKICVQTCTEMGKIGHPLMLCVFWYTPSNINKKKTFPIAHHYEKYQKFCFFFLLHTGDIFASKVELFGWKNKVANWVNMWNCLLQISKKFYGDLLSNQRIFQKGLQVGMIQSFSCKISNWIPG